jgi:hypothetical protein
MKNVVKTTLIAIGAVVIAVSVTNCKKDAALASKISRALLTTPDSSVFSPFYDSTKVAYADVIPGVNDVIASNGVFSIIKSNCASATCHGGGVSPLLTSYAQIKSLVVPGNPANSKLFQMITTNDNNNAMPPINYGVDLSATEKSKIYNWILNGANENPTLADYRPAAVAIIASGCASGNCHNEATVGGEWARKSLFAYSSSDTLSFVYNNPGSGTTTYYAQLKNPLLTTVWNAYKDSVRQFYADTVANASYRPFKTFGLPWTTASRRGPLNTYDDIIMDVYYPKGIRSNSSVVYTDPGTGAKYYAKGDYLNTSTTLLIMVDSTLFAKNVRTKVWGTSKQGSMAYSDGGLSPSEVALVKAWYFADTNIPDVWKFGTDGTGIFKYRTSGNIITK